MAIFEKCQLAQVCLILSPWDVPVSYLFGHHLMWPNIYMYILYRLYLYIINKIYVYLYILKYTLYTHTHTHTYIHTYTYIHTSIHLHPDSALPGSTYLFSVIPHCSPVINMVWPHQSSLLTSASLPCHVCVIFSLS